MPAPVPTPTVTLHDGTHVRLGRIRPPARRNVLRLAAYLSDAPPPPESVNYAGKAAASIGRMYLNDRYGDCVIASYGHAVGVWSGNTSPSPILATDREISDAYFGICGPNDQGCDIASVLDYARDHGIVLGGAARKIDGYVSVDWTSKAEVCTAIYLFGTLKIGLNLPSSWAAAPTTWDVTNSGIEGGHDVCAVGYDSAGVTVSTWGSTRLITWAAFLSTRWIDECYVALSPMWYENANLSPSGLDVATLKDDLAKIAGGVIPPIRPSPVPVPVPVPVPTPVPVPVPIPTPPPIVPPTPVPVPQPPPTPIPTPTPVPTPTPIPTPPPAPVGLTLDQAVAAVKTGIESNRYGIFNVVGKVEAVAVQSLVDAWPKH